ncbi:MAG: heme exporter protein CcmB [Cyclobacteriaceae bacterium]|nr:heme exporter protein CcmB [Cyclobacteriaceae bacterium]MCH8514941.1 heme exporter protein CcmB [Cyclobacteriaceae bacterium]
MIEKIQSSSWYIAFLKEVKIEWRQKFTVYGIFLYMISTVFIVYLGFQVRQGVVDPVLWNTLFWIILLFSAVNAIAKSFLSESRGLMLYYFTVHSPTSFLFAKLFYHFLLFSFISILGLGIYSVILGNPVQDPLMFFLSIILGSLGFTGVFTFVSAIASKAAQGAVMMAVLGFPIVIPILLMAIKSSKNAMDGLDRAVTSGDILTLGAIDLIVWSAALMLFPFLWKN